MSVKLIYNIFLDKEFVQVALLPIQPLVGAEGALRLVDAEPRTVVAPDITTQCAFLINNLIKVTEIQFLSFYRLRKCLTNCCSWNLLLQQKSTISVNTNYNNRWWTYRPSLLKRLGSAVCVQRERQICTYTVSKQLIRTIFEGRHKDKYLCILVLSAIEKVRIDTYVV